MAHNTRYMLTDATGKTPIPQYLDPFTDTYKPLTNEGMLSIRDSFEGITTITKIYPSQMRGFSIQNDSAENITFTINGLSIKLKPTEGFEDIFEPFTSVQITANGAFRAVVRG